MNQEGVVFHKNPFNGCLFLNVGKFHNTVRFSLISKNTYLTKKEKHKAITQSWRFRCAEASQILWQHQRPMGEKFFQVQCVLGGVFQLPDDGWPLCDSPSPQKCEDYPEPPEIVELVNRDPQLPGGKVFYKCKEEGFISNIGPLVEVKWL